MDLYVFILLILAVSLVAISVFLFKRHSIPGMKPFIVCILLVSIWNSLEVANLLLNSMNSKIIWFGIINLFNNLDTTSISFGISIIVSIYGILRYRFMDLVLVAREYAFEDMDELMIILDENKKIVDMNKKALKMFNTDISTAIGTSINQIIKEINNYNFCDLQESTLKIQLENSVFDKKVNYYGSLSAIKGNKNCIIGYLILLYDTTELIITQNKLRHANNELRRLNERLYNDSIKDGLTRVYNKKYITQVLKEEIKKSSKNFIPFTVAIIDIDHFKEFNDNYGHLIGDKVLEKVSELITVELGDKGKVGRFGGEEFLILMFDASLKVGYELCEKIRCKVSNYRFEYECSTITVSIGLAELKSEDSINSLIKRADDCLYKAKRNGRNKIELSEVFW